MTENIHPEQNKTELGKTGIQISTLGLGAWQWGDTLMWGWGNGYGQAEVEAAFRASLQAGINFIDTAEVYGFGRSEKILGKFLKMTGEPLVVATKFFPFPWRITRGAYRRALQNSLKRLGLTQVDLYQFHAPVFVRPVETWAEAMADALDEGLTRAVGISNFNAESTRKTGEVLARRGHILASNQMEYHLLDRRIERNGVLEACRELGATLIAYSPLAKGMLTGKYSGKNPPPGSRRRIYSPEYLERIQPLLERMRAIGAAHGDKTPAQVAINWCSCKGAVPIPGAKNQRQAQENAGAYGWRLSEAALAELDSLSAEVQRAG